MYYYLRFKNLAKRLNILDNYETDLLNIIYPVNDGKFGKIYIQLDFKANEYCVQLRVSEEQYNNLFIANGSTPKMDSRVALNFTHVHKSLEDAIKDIEQIFFILNQNSNSRLDNNTTLFINRAKNIIGM